MTHKIGFMIGSLRKDSWSRKIARVMINELPEEYSAVVIDTGNLPLYNEDLDSPEQMPQSWKALRNEIPDLDGIIIVTPEYNRSIPANLKNTLDVGSRPLADNVWNNKPTLVVSQSTGAIGGFGAATHLQSVLKFLNMPTMNQPEVYLSKSPELFDDSGEMISGTKKFLNSVLQDYVKFVEKHQ